MTNPVSTSGANRVTIVQYGTREGRRSEVYLNYGLYGQPDEPIGMDYFLWLVDTPSGPIVVDTGFSAAGGANRSRTFLATTLLTTLACASILPVMAETPPQVTVYRCTDAKRTARCAQ